MATSPNYGGNLHPFVGLINNGHNLALQTLVTAAAATPVKISALSVSSTDTSNRDVQIWKTVSGVDYLVCTITVPANAGNLAITPPVNLLAHVNWTWFEVDAVGNRMFLLEATAILKAAVLVQVTTAKVISFVGNGQDFA